MTDQVFDLFNLNLRGNIALIIIKTRLTKVIQGENMYINSKIAKAVRIAMMFGAGAAVTVSTQAFSAEEAQADKNKDVERIEVTGSRIKRTDLEGASPVTVISTANMKIEGNLTVADALRGSTFNSFGSFSERSGSSAQSQATLNLRGAGSNRTLVLLDGKRMPGSPTLGGQSANLNAIPMAAVERVEILTDGASSTYGSDAIAGVVNIILKKNYEGLEFNIGTGHRDRDKGQTSNEFSILGGMSSDKGNITFAFDHQSREGISDGARDYTKAKMTDVNGDGIIQAYSETDGWSIYGATVAPPDFSEAQASPECDNLISQYGNDVFSKVAADDDWGPGSTYCMYAYANVSYNRASIDRNTVFVDANYEVADGVEWFGRAMFVQNNSFGRYAPPAAAWKNMKADNPNNLYGVDGAYGFFRWVGVGTRDGNISDYNQDYLTGLRGDLSWHNASWEVYYHRNAADNKSVGEYYLSYAGLAYNQANDIDLGSAEGIANLKSTTLQQSTATMDQVYGGIGFDFGELSGGSIAHYFGMEYFSNTYGDIYDGQSEAGLIGGSAGNSAQGDRNVKAVFYESALPVTDEVELNFAARYDEYSDAGHKLSPKISARWQVTESLVLRTSYSEAFRAPGLDDLNAATTFSAESAVDYKTGKTTSKQYDTYIRSNKNLTPETSKYLNFGLAWDINNNIGVKVDYFNLDINNVIQQKSLQTLLSDEQAGNITALSPDADTSSEVFYLKRTDAGVLVEAGTGYFNGIGFKIRGIDTTLSLNYETDFGDIRYNLTNSFVLEYTSEFGGELRDQAGWSGTPDQKSVSTLSWTMGDHSVAWNMKYTSSTSEDETVNSDTGNVDISGKLDSWIIHNLTYTYDAGSYGAITFTINNLTDEDPVLNKAGQFSNADLYDNFGRDYRLNYRISF